MVALDSSFADAGNANAPTSFTRPIVLVALVAAVAVAAVSFALADPGYRWRGAAEMVSRFSMVVFVLAMIAEPLGRIFRTKAMRAAGQERGSLILAFAMITIVSLACTMVPSQLGGGTVVLSSFIYSVITGGIVLAMLFSAHPATKSVLGGPAWRTIQRIATGYFWLVFTLTAVQHMTGTDHADGWWGISLLLLTGAVLLRFTDALLFKLRTARMAEKAA